MRIAKVIFASLLSLSAISISSTVLAGSRDAYPAPGDQLIGRVDGGGSGVGMQEVVGIATDLLGIRVPGLSSNAFPQRPQPPRYQNNSYSGSYGDDTGTPALDFYQECRDGYGQVNRRCAANVDRKITALAQREGRTFLCPDGYGRTVRTQAYRNGCRLEYGY